MEIAACGSMPWNDEAKAYVFHWKIPDDFKPDPLLVVEIDVFEDEDRVGGAQLFRWLAAGSEFRAHFPGRRGDNGPGTEEPDMPKPPGMVLIFDLNELLADIRPLVLS